MHTKELREEEQTILPDFCISPVPCNSTYLNLFTKIQLKKCTIVTYVNHKIWQAQLFHTNKFLDILASRVEIITSLTHITYVVLF